MAARLGLIFMFGLFIEYTFAEKEIVCPEVNGFYADSRDCYIFYRCVAGQPYQFFCPSGTFYDPIENVCNWPREVEDCDTQGRRIYYENENRLQFGENTFERKPVAEPDSSNTPDSQPEYDFYPDRDLQQSRVEEGEFVCPESEGFFPHPYDCKKFFRCVSTKPFPFICSHGTFFDQSISVCNFPERVSECDANGNRHLGETVHNRDQSGRIEDASHQASYNPEMHTTGFIPCLDQYSLYPHPKSCTKFIYCHEYKGLLFECPRGLNFDRRKLTCDFPQNAPC